MYTAIDAQQDQMLMLLQTLVNIDSGSFYKPGIDQCILILKAEFDKLGMDTTVVELPDRGNHLIARKAGTGSQRLLLVGHCDTVFDTGTVAARPFRIEDGRAYGPGVVDMKGGLTTIVFALRALRDNAPAAWSALNVTVVVNSDEEISSGSSRPIIEAEARQAAAICVLEPARPGGEYVTQRKGSGTFTLRVKGINAHAGMNPELGASAIHELIGKLAAAQALNNARPGLTINVGVIHGGSRPNVVADFSEAEIDVRTQTLADGDWVTAQMQAIAAQTGVPRTTTELSGGISFPPMPRTEQNLKLFELVHQAGAELGLDLKHVSTGGASDANYASQFAPTCDGMGPQGGRQHSPDEYLIVATLPERTKVLARFITLWGADQK
jgi:glutamate carboxypeptidase